MQSMEKQKNRVFLALYLSKKREKKSMDCFMCILHQRSIVYRKAREFNIISNTFSIQRKQKL